MSEDKFARIHWNPEDHQFPLGSKCVIEVTENLSPVSQVLNDAVIVPGIVYSFDGEYEGLVRVELPVKVLPVVFDSPEEAAQYTEADIGRMYYEAEGERQNALYRLAWLAIIVSLIAALVGLILILRSQGVL